MGRIAVEERDPPPNETLNRTSARNMEVIVKLASGRSPLSSVLASIRPSVRVRVL